MEGAVVRVVFFELDALIGPDRRRRPHVRDALTTIAAFETVTGTSLATALVSNAGPTPTPSTRRDQTARVVQRVRATIEAAGIAPFFEPADRRVTLAAQAGAPVPQRPFFEAALKRLPSKAPFRDCLLVTSSGEHARSVRRQLAMPALQFGPRGAAGVDFSDWSQAPGLVAHLIDGGAGPSSIHAVRRFLHVAHAFEAETIEAKNRGRRLGASGTCWTPVVGSGDSMRGSRPEPGSDAEGSGPLYLPFPASCLVSRTADGAVDRVDIEGPSEAEVAEASAYARSLLRHGQVRGTRGRIGSGVTHEIEIDDQGRRKLVRKRFSAI